MVSKCGYLQRQAWLRARARRRRLVRTAQVMLLVGFFFLWELSARLGWIDPFIVSSPARIWKTIGNLLSTGELWRHLGTSCLETAAGFLLGTAAGALIAVVLWLSPTL